MVETRSQSQKSSIKVCVTKSYALRPMPTVEVSIQQLSVQTYFLRPRPAKASHVHSYNLRPRK